MTTGDWFDSEGTNWLLQNGYEDHPWNIIYLASYHWALAQFGLASSPIAASNGPEWTYSILVLFLGIVISALIVSTVTGMMTQWQQVNSELLIQSAQLQRFMAENGVSADLTDCITHWFRQKYEERKRRVHEKDLLFINDLPEALRITLRREVYLPIISSHPFFHAVKQFNPTGINMLCYIAVTQVYRLAQEKVFTYGQRAKSMFFIKSGDVEYLEPPSACTEELKEATPGRGSLCSERASGVYSTADVGNHFKSASSLTSEKSKVIGNFQRQRRNSVTSTLDSLMPEQQHRKCPGCWASEAALWSRSWRYKGDLIAVTSCELVVVDASKLSVVLRTFNLAQLRPFQVYASLFKQLIESPPVAIGSAGKIADVCEDKYVLTEIVKTAFEHQRPTRGTYEKLMSRVSRNTWRRGSKDG
eukprot:gnl/TRDRNA2_/TRDRNA2_173149_c1_seq2.p1 gnl/TRDRNA2_/TRDRNA2_173149_c1~~gnl/TRDRNA2_/TRDRNA2_173149_c1_seq2.p1  ORF type:complete len:488 (-),score=59.29 gnl/TRDRNA2_/TRDRNA2_173149_c1_seq2:703-1953(-)